jgi:hypothetical protein
LKEPIMILDPDRFERLLNRDDLIYPLAPYYPEEREDAQALPPQDAPPPAPLRLFKKLWSAWSRMSEVRQLFIKASVSLVGSAAILSASTGSWDHWYAVVLMLVLLGALTQFLDFSSDR